MNKAWSLFSVRQSHLEHVSGKAIKVTPWKMGFKVRVMAGCEVGERVAEADEMRGSLNEEGGAEAKEGELCNW